MSERAQEPTEARPYPSAAAQHLKALRAESTPVTQGAASESSTPSFPHLTTHDGSLTFYSPEFRQAFHNPNGAREEAREKFVLPSGIIQQAPQGRVYILDVCFGLGYNSAIALEIIWRLYPTCQVHLLALERSPAVPQQAAAAGIWADWPAAPEFLTLINQGQVITPRLSAQMLWGDARQTIQQVPTDWAEAVFFDPFAPSACPELWTVEFLTLVAQRLGPRGRLVTYSCAAAVRQGLQLAGLQLGSTPPVGRPWPGTVAAWDPTDLPPLSPMEREHLDTCAGEPYRDPTLRATALEIRQARQRQQQRTLKEPTAVWKERWGL